MFDPTAFDNMKVIIEGALYDLDINGDIVVVDRNDIVNMAKMCRQFDLTFQLSDTAKRHVIAKLIMESQLVNLAAELVPGLKSENLVGSMIRLEFHLEDMGNFNNFQGIQTLLLDIWGANRRITQLVQYNLFSETQTIVIRIDFDRLVSEDQMEDLIQLADVMVTTIHRLQAF